MKSIIFDTGPIISLTMNNLLWILKHLEKQFDGDFLITPAVRKELIEKPFRTKKFKFEALQVMFYLNKGTLKLMQSTEIKKRAEKLWAMANKCYRAHGKNIEIIHYAEAEALAAAIELKAEAFCVDERTTRLLIEDPARLSKILKNKLHTKVQINHKKLKDIKKEVKGINLIRSAELVTIAYEMGLLENYIKHTKVSKKDLLDSILWGVKLDGCAISGKEIKHIIEMEK